MKYKLFLIAMALLISGCASLHVKEVTLLGDDVNFPRTHYRNVTLLETKPSASYTEIAAIVVESSNRQQIEDALRKKAAALGANAVYIKDESQEELANVTDAGCGCGRALKKHALVIFRVKAVAIRYK